MSNLVELFDNVVEFQNYNGVPLAAGKLYVFALGRTRLMDTWSDIDGESLNTNPIILDDIGQCHCYVSDAFDYTIVVCDQFDNEIFSVDKYLLSKGEHSHADVAVAPSEHIGVSSYHVGEVTVYVPYLTGEVGKVYEGIDPIVVNNDVNRISANHIPLGVQDPLYFVEDSETACILGCSAQTEIPAELSGKWDEASDAVIANSAQWAEGTEYEAGSNIDITDNVISGKDWSSEINDASAAATAWTDSQNYLTGVDLSEYAKESFVISAIDSSTSGLLPTSAFATASGSFITALPDDLATTGFVADVSADITAMIPTALTGDYLTKDSADTLYQPIGQYQSALDFGYVGSEISSINGSGIYSQGGTANPQIPVTGINGIKISESGDKVVFEVSANYATEDWVTGQGYLTAETDWTNTITAASANAYNEATAAIPTGLATTGDLQNVSGEITALIPTALTGDYVEKSAINTITGDNGEYTWTAITGIDNVWISASEAAYASQALTAATAGWADHALVAEVAEDWKGASGKLDNSASANFYPSDNPSAFITGVDLTPYQLTADMTAYQPTGDYLTTADSANFYTTANESGFISEVPDTYLQNTDLSTEDGKVTAISGIPLSAGGDVPEGVMAESGLEYNAVNEISAYNGSAIAQYGAEKQWLQHDDTIVHVSNSAQYAFGVNLSAVAQLLGVDETVLFSGTRTSAATISEPLSAFERINIYMNRGDENVGQAPSVLTFSVGSSDTYVQLNWSLGANGWYNVFQKLTWTNNSVNVVSAHAIFGSNFTATTISHESNTTLLRNTIQKVIGIGRKA